MLDIVIQRVEIKMKTKQPGIISRNEEKIASLIKELQQILMSTYGGDYAFRVYARGFIIASSNKKEINDHIMAKLLEKLGV